MSNIEQTLSIIKPDAVERNLTDNIKKIFERNNLKILNGKKIHVSKEEAAEFFKLTTGLIKAEEVEVFSEDK